MRQLCNTRGYTLVELVVVMAIFVTVMLITSNSFLTVTRNVSQQSKSAETQIQGIVGLELLRADLQQAGFGLPWTFQDPAFTYDEAQVTSNDIPGPGIWPSGSPPAGSYWVNFFNDAPSSAPRAVLSANTAFNKDNDGVGSKYLVIKSTVVAPVTNSVGDAPAARKWTTVSFSGGGHTKREWGDPARDLSDSDRVIVVKNSLNTTPPTQQLMVNAGSFFSTFDNYSTLTQPHQDGDTFEVYGVHPSAELSMPFNRADYYVMTPASGMPQTCAPNTGILYKSVLNQANGQLSGGTALLDCVADMQVVYGLDTSGSGFVNDHPSVLPAGATALDIRSQLREIRVYILSHEGKRDRSYSHPSRYITVGEKFGELVRGRVFDLQERIGPEWQRYRWKVYTIVARPKNLIQ